MLSRVVRVIPKNFFCNEVRKYTPLRPMIEDKNLVYVSKDYQKKFATMYIRHSFAFLPAALVLLHNFLTQWTLLNGMGFFVATIFAIAFNIKAQIDIGQLVLSLEVSKDMNTLYAVVSKSTSSRIAFKKYPLPKKEIKNFEYYTPFLDQNEKSNLQNLSEEKKKALKDFSKSIVQLKIPASEISSIFLTIDKKQQKQYERDKEKLEPQDLFVKYQKHFLIIQTKHFINKSLPFCLIMQLQKNGDRKFHDYLMAWGTGYEVSQNHTKKYQPPKQKSEEQNK